MLSSKILWCLLPFVVSIRGYAVSMAVSWPTQIDPSVNTVSPGFPNIALAARDIKAINLQTTTSSTSCGSDPCKSSTTSSASCSSSEPCPKDTTETETHLATVTLQTTEMQTAYITDHVTTTQHTVRMFTKVVNVAETVTSTSTVTGCSTFTTIVTTVWSTTTTTNIHPAPTSTSSGCGSASCTVTTSVFTDKDVTTSTTPASTATASGHDIVEVISEEKMKELLAKKMKEQEVAEKKKDIADKEPQQNGAGKNAAKLIARQSMESDGDFSAVGGLIKEASVAAATPPALGTTLVTMTLRVPRGTENVGTKTTTQSPSVSARKPRFEGSEAGMVDSAASSTLTARSSLACITIRSQGAHSTICPDSSCWNGDC